MRRILPVAVLVLAAVALVAGSAIRNHAGIEYSPDSLQAYVLGLGAIAPLIFVTILTFRQFLLLPSMLILTVGGLVFGAVFGTLLGGLGIVLSALVMFGVARGLRHGWVGEQLATRFRKLDERVEAAGPVVIALATAHPIGPMSPLHWAAGLSSIGVRRFLVVIVLAGSFRAFAYSFFGSTLAEVGSRDFFIATLGLAAAFLLPMLHRGVREKVIGRRAGPAPAP